MTALSATVVLPGTPVVTHSAEHVKKGSKSANATCTIVEISLGTFLTAHGSPGTSPPAIVSYRGSLSSLGVPISATTTSLSTTCIVEEVSKLAFDLHCEVSPGSGVGKSCMTPITAPLLVAFGTSVGATSVTGCATGEIVVSTHIVGIAVEALKNSTGLGCISVSYTHASLGEGSYTN